MSPFVTLRMAREIRAVILHDRNWRWWHFGFMPWFTINWMLMTFDEKRASLSARIKSSRRALDAVFTVWQALRENGDVLMLRELWQEFQLRDEKAFNSRDRQFFMRRMGCLFNESAYTLLATAMTLQTSDFLVLKYLCCKTCRYMDSRIRRVGLLESTLVTYFIDHKAECCQRIQHFKPTVLNMARQYVDNMIAFCLQHDLKNTAHRWAHVGHCIVHLQELTPTDDNATVLIDEATRFFSLFKLAAAEVYVAYQDLDRRLDEEHEKDIAETLYLPYREPPPADAPAQPPITDAPARTADAWSAFYGRNVLWFHISDDGSTISDTTSLDAYGRYAYVYTGITENASVVRKGLAFFFADFERHCQARQDESGDWVVTKENDFIKMSNDEMKKFKTSLRAISGMSGFIPDVLSPKSREIRSDGKPNNRSGKYRIDPRPGICSDDGVSCQADAID